MLELEIVNKDLQTTVTLGKSWYTYLHLHIVTKSLEVFIAIQKEIKIYKDSFKNCMCVSILLHFAMITFKK